MSLEILLATLTHLQRRGYVFVGFQEFMQRRREGGVALLSFDDAYRTVIRVALPVLKARGIPAVVFVVTGRITSADPFPIWLHALRDKRSVLDESAAAPFVSHRLVRRVIATSGFGSLAELLLQPLGIPTGAFRETLSQAELEELAEIVMALPGVGRTTMNEADIRELLQSDLIELGAHSITHRSFARLSNQEIEAEIEGSIATVEALCGSPSASLAFAYPYGAVTAHAARYVSRKCRAGLTCYARPVTAMDPAATLPRINLDRNAIFTSQNTGTATNILALAHEKVRLHLYPRLAFARRWRSYCRAITAKQYWTPDSSKTARRERDGQTSS